MTEYAVGEDIDGSFNGGSQKMPVKYTATVAAGNPLKISGNNQTEDNTNVTPSTASTDATRFLAIHNGIADDVKEALLYGRTKVELGGAATAGEPAEILADGTFQNQSTGETVGFFLQTGVDEDFVMMVFDGRLST